MTDLASGVWTNWVGNQRFTPARRVAPSNEAEAREIVADAVRSGVPLRAVGGGHSFSPIVETRGTLLDTGAMRGIVAVDRERATIKVRPGTTVRELGEPLWKHGLALDNMGDIDTQTIAGAVATATHGSGRQLQSFSAMVRGARIVDGRGGIVNVSAEDDPDLLRASQVAIGTLGVMTEMVLQVVPAYFLGEDLRLLPVEEVLDTWDSLLSHRHFSFFWLPRAESASLYGLSPPEDSPLSDLCYVKIYDEVSSDEGDAAAKGRYRRVDRSYRIYPSVFEPNFYEMEYMVPIQYGPEVFREVRDLVQRKFPENIFPVEIRFTARDRAMLSPNYGTDTAVISVSGDPGLDYRPFLRSVDDVFQHYHGRPHWGKINFMTPSRMADLFPEYEHFREIRRELDPHGLFLNDTLAALLA